MQKYYECHITIEPVYDERLALFTEQCSRFNFKPAKLLMQKDRKETPERSNKDTFCTGHSKEYDDIYNRMMSLVKVLQSDKFAVWRYKIEDVILDVKLDKV
jgi:hypothetical protein